MNEKVFSLDGENYNITDRDELIEGLMCLYNTQNKLDLIGKEYFEGDPVKPAARDFVNVDSIVDSINENAYENHREWAEDWPDLTREEKDRLEDLIVRFLEEKAPPSFYGIENSVAKKIMAEDL
ncbi:MAG: hypothetical protein LBQ88_07235 [Treponema sp.]|jgi:hypothetical protein|nr:hypothetical protein [Treponema sp.]